ncbi:phosphoketolase family protein [Pelagicoccus sp. SDUM812002]|uniref:phosphoketolase family protein n=1 Tax=Pelagicoccus sp. SDUM812002 TaxID=3041266 RepID=UPI00280DF55C|nr:phosphoketolase family protein [Pelagicoccus sp. SDUM812002]MDQ8186208.1 phosphoketolase family protein [Pelagicoccus sp. SDUM812002]
MPQLETNATSSQLAGLGAVDAYWRAANYLSAAQVFLRGNTLLREPLASHHIKPRLLGHWGTCPGLTFVYSHLNRIIKRTERETLFIAGPGHGGAAINACAFLDKSYAQTYPDYPYNSSGIEKLVTQFSWPGGASSHVSPYTPGSIHEGGELGYALGHAFGAVLDNPKLVAACVVGDGEAETGPTAAAWHANKFLNPQIDGAVLPILHLNEYKIASPTLFSALSKDELDQLFKGYGYEPLYVEGNEPEEMHAKMAKVLEQCYQTISEIQDRARKIRQTQRPIWPLIILRTPKGWTGPEELDGNPVEGSFRSHQVPLAKAGKGSSQLTMLADWLAGYQPETLFDPDGKPSQEVQENVPSADLAMSLSPHSNGGAILRELDLPPWSGYAHTITEPGSKESNPSGTLGKYLRDIVSKNPDNFRIVSPDETKSNRLGAVFEVTNRIWMHQPEEGDTDLGPGGRVMEVLSEHLCQGWLEGYLLTGRHGLFSSYEAFIHLVDSMLNQYAKWIKVCKETSWRKPVASLNYHLSSHVWQQDHNGFTHQDPGFLDHVINKKADMARVYLPPDTNTLLSVADHCLRSRNYINVIVTGKKDTPSWFDHEQAATHCDHGMSVLPWAGSLKTKQEPQLVLACAGDVPTLETIATAELLKVHAPDLRFSVVNIVDLLCIQDSDQHPHGKSEADFEDCFPSEVPVIFAFHGYPWLIHRLLHERRNNHRFEVRGYREEGGTTTPFDMLVQNQLDRYSLLKGAAKFITDSTDAGRVAGFADLHLARHHNYIREHGVDMPEVESFKP